MQPADCFFSMLVGRHGKTGLQDGTNNLRMMPSDANQQCVYQLPDSWVVGVDARNDLRYDIQTAASFSCSSILQRIPHHHPNQNPATGGLGAGAAHLRNDHKPCVNRDQPEALLQRCHGSRATTMCKPQRQQAQDVLQSQDKNV